MYDGYEYMVSIICETYNHAPYVRQCIEGFLMQKTDFAIEILIHDDASSDGTPDIIREYAEKHPDLFKPIYQVENQYSKGVNIWHDIQFPRARGKYIAICEGDDYWTDPLKLQKQVEFLEKNADCSLCFHDVKVYAEVEKRYVKKFNLPNYSRKYTSRHLFSKGWFVPTASILFVNSWRCEDMLEYQRRNCPLTGGDILLQLCLSKKGSLAYLSEVMGVYRFGVPGSATYRNRGTSVAHAQYLKLLRYTNRYMFNGRFGFFVFYRYMRFFFHRIVSAIWLR